MKNIIEDGAKFAIKEVDEAGNSMGVGAERFDTKEEAQAFIDGAEGEATEAVEPEATIGEQPSTEVEPASDAVEPEAGAESNGEVL